MPVNGHTGGGPVPVLTVGVRATGGRGLCVDFLWHSVWIENWLHFRQRCVLYHCVRWHLLVSWHQVNSAVGNCNLFQNYGIIPSTKFRSCVRCFQCCVPLFQPLGVSSLCDRHMFGERWVFSAGLPLPETKRQVTAARKASSVQQLLCVMS